MVGFAILSLLVRSTVRMCESLQSLEKLTQPDPFTLNVWNGPAFSLEVSRKLSPNFRKEPWCDNITFWKCGSNPVVWTHTSLTTVLEQPLWVVIAWLWQASVWQKNAVQPRNVWTRPKDLWLLRVWWNSMLIADPSNIITTLQLDWSSITQHILLWIKCYAHDHRSWMQKIQRTLFDHFWDRFKTCTTSDVINANATQHLVWQQFNKPHTT